MNSLSSVKQRFEATDTNRIVGFCRTAVYQILCLICAALLSSIDGLGVISPFGVAFAVSVQPKYLIASCFGASAGYVMSQDSLSALRYICAILCGAVMISLVRQFERIKKYRLLEACTVFLTLLLTSVTVLFAGTVSFNSFAVFLGEACVGFAAAYMFTAARDSIMLFRTQRGFETRDFTVVLVCGFLVLLSVSGISVASVSFSRILVAFSVLSASIVLTDNYVAAAVVAGLVFSADSAVGSAAFLYAAAGLAVSLIGNVGKLFKTVLFFITYSVLYAFFVASSDRLYLIIEVLAASIAVALVPEKAFRKANSKLISAHESENALGLRRQLLSRLNSAADAIDGISDCVSAAAELLKTQSDGSENTVYVEVRDEVCSKCGHFALCWTKNFSDCKRSFDMMSETLRSNRKLRADKLPRFLSGCCVNKQDLVDCFVHRYLENVISGSMQRQVDAIRQNTAEQLGGLNMMFSEIALEMARPLNFDEPLADSVYNMLEDEFSLRPKSATCSRDEAGSLKIEIFLTQKPEKIKEADLRESLEALCGATLSPPEIRELENEIALVFCERTKYRVEAAASRSCAESEGVCGDSYEGFYDSQGNYYAVLSDGMGTGLRAAVDSSLTVTMAAKLIKAGFSCPSAMNFVNSAMLLKSSKETLSTVDIVKVDLYTGKASFFKAGACQSLIKRKSRLIEVGAESMPLGILKDVELSEQSVQLNAGDLILMGSDGAYEYAGNAARDSFAVSLDESAAQISQRVLLAAKKARENERSDDITVIAVRLCKNG